jgi:hypothetical protein
MEKVCTKCKEVKSLDEFHKHKGKPYGRAIWCKKCACRNSKNNYENTPRERRLSLKREWQSKNRSHINSYNESIRKKYPHKHAERQRLRNARLQKAEPDWVDDKHKDRIVEIYLCAKNMSDKFGRKYHVDHIVPLKGENVCGLHVWWNLQILEASRNLSKSNKFNGGW